MMSPPPDLRAASEVVAGHADPIGPKDRIRTLEF